MGHRTRLHNSRELKHGAFSKASYLQRRELTLQTPTAAAALQAALKSPLFTAAAALPMPDGSSTNGRPAPLPPPLQQQQPPLPWPAQLRQWHAHPILLEIAISGTGVACGTTCTNPIDVVKTRLQLRPASSASGSRSSPGMLSTGASIVRQEGVLGLWRGWTPAVLRGMLYGGLRLGLYNPVKQAMAALNGGSSSSSSSSSSSCSRERGCAAPLTGMSSKLLAGVVSGASAAALLSPTELVKVRLQAPGASYSGALDVVAAVLRESGVRGLWKGATPGVVRAGVLTASQCATYDEVKGAVMRATGWRDNAATHLGTALITGVVSTTATNPVDVIKTFMFVGGNAHSSPFSCAAAIYALHGWRGFWRGWLANYARLGPQTVVTFVTVEQLRALAGMAPLGG